MGLTSCTSSQQVSNRSRGKIQPITKHERFIIRYVYVRKESQKVSGKKNTPLTHGSWRTNVERSRNEGEEGAVALPSQASFSLLPQSLPFLCKTMEQKKWPDHLGLIPTNAYS